MPLKVWNGSSWVSASTARVWNGSSWVSAAAAHVWNGSSWIQFFPDGTPNISNKTSAAYGLAYDSGSADASIIHYFYFDKTYFIDVSSSGFPDNSSYTTGDTGTQTDWLSGGTTSDFSMKYTYTGNAPLVQIGATNFASTNTWYVMADNAGTAASFILNSVQSGVGSAGESSAVTISIARTSDTSTVLDTALLSMTTSASVNDSPTPD
jgi:hypothetical protein